MSEDTQTASARDFYPTAYERSVLNNARKWFAEFFPAGMTPVPAAAQDKTSPLLVDEDDPRLLLICMTPRSGSSALSAALASTGQMGQGGERLSRNILSGIVAEHRPANLRDLLERVIVLGRTPDGLSQIKCDLLQVLPFLLDPACFRLLRNARLVYLSREDVLGQAISRYRGFKAGVWHSKTEAGYSGVDAPYDFAAISAQVNFIVNMMQGYERAFALLAMQPLRISYEQLTSDPGTVLARIAALMGVILPPGMTLEDGGYRQVSDDNNDNLRQRYLEDCRKRLGFA